jgi:subtilisin family serine protease
MKRIIPMTILIIILTIALVIPASAAGSTKLVSVNVVLNTDVTNAILADLGTHGKVNDVLYEIDALTMKVREGKLATIHALSYVAAVNPDAKRDAAPIDLVAAENFAGGLNTWDLDAVNVTDFGAGRVASYDGSGVYVAVLDTGLVDVWRAYFPQERIATQFAKAFSGASEGANAEPTNQWEHDQNSHGTHVTSTILGYSLNGTPINGVAPKVTVIPVKVLGQSGSGSSSMVARGIVYVTDLKVNGQLGNSPLVINMSLGGDELDAMEKAAIDYAVANGVIIVASAGNSGEDGMGYPGAYEPVISVAASGWVGEWSVAGSWWRTLNVADPTNANDFYITDFSSRELAGQDLDVAAPGSWVVGPYKVNSGMSLSYYYLGGTSMASPHVAGIVALMAQKNPALTAAQAEGIVTGAAIPLAPGCRNVMQPAGMETFCWGADATGAGLITADAALTATP